MQIDIITIFPQYFSPLELSLLGKAQEKEIINFNIVNLRDFTQDLHKTVDDTPYGGGAGMLMKADILKKAIDNSLKTNPDAKLIFTAAFGETFEQKTAQFFADSKTPLIFICGRFEGYDARITEHYRLKLGENRVFEMAIGNYVLFGGEVAVLTMIEAITRLIPGVIGNPESLSEESHSFESDSQALEYPSFTRPFDFEGLTVPEVLLSGNHAAVEKWRKENRRKK